MKLRFVAPDHKEWVPHGYQLRAVDHLCTRGSAALFLDPGMGKTAVTLAAFSELQEAGIAKRMLVIAPMRVCQLVWQQEAQKWTQFRHLKFANMAGKPADKRKAMLQADADIWLINPESVKWLCDLYKMRTLPFDTVVVDELTRFKNPRAERSKAIYPLADRAPRRWGLTGTPVPNGYMDLFGQMRLLDGGASLGKYITHFRDRFFQQGRDGFSYELRPGADKAIEKAVEPYVFRAAAEDYLSLPPLIDNPIELELSPEAEKVYKQMKRDMLVALEGTTITAANAAATYNKLQQLAGGAIYTDKHPEFIHVHDTKLDALADLVEQVSGQPLLVAYAYGHELDRLLVRFPNTPFIGGGVSAKRAEEIERDWNEGKLPLLFAHPASVGHGLNMQRGNAQNLCWFTQTWDYELYDQFIRRIHRQGNDAPRIFNHKLIVRGTIDELVEEALDTKSTTQDALLIALKSEFVKDDPAASAAFSRGVEMRRLSSPGQSQTSVQPAQSFAPPPAAPAAIPGGWGAPPAAPQPAPTPPSMQDKITGAATPGGWGAQPQFTQPAHEERQISTGEERAEITTQPASHFSPAIQEQIAQPGGAVWDASPVAHLPDAKPVEETPKATRTRKRKTDEADVQVVAQTIGGEPTEYGNYRVSLNVDAAFGVALHATGNDIDRALEIVGILLEGVRVANK